MLDNHYRVRHGVLGESWHPVAYSFVGEKILWGLDEVNKISLFSKIVSRCEAPTEPLKVFLKVNASKAFTRWTIGGTPESFFVGCVKKNCSPETFRVGNFWDRSIWIFDFEIFLKFFLFFWKNFFRFQTFLKAITKDAQKKIIFLFRIFSSDPDRTAIRFGFIK